MAKCDDQICFKTDTKTRELLQQVANEEHNSLSGIIKAIISKGLKEFYGKDING